MKEKVVLKIDAEMLIKFAYRGYLKSESLVRHQRGNISLLFFIDCELFFFLRLEKKNNSLSTIYIKPRFKKQATH